MKQTQALVGFSSQLPPTFVHNLMFQYTIWDSSGMPLKNLLETILVVNVIILAHLSTSVSWHQLYPLWPSTEEAVKLWSVYI